MGGSRIGKGDRTGVEKSQWLLETEFEEGVEYEN